MEIMGKNNNAVQGSFLSSDVVPNNHTHNATTPIVKVNHSREFDFEFAYDVGILALSDEVLRTHKFEIVNVTLSGKIIITITFIFYII